MAIIQKYFCDDDDHDDVDEDDDDDDDADTLDAVGRQGVADPPFSCNFKLSGQQTSFSSPFVVMRIMKMPLVMKRIKIIG